MINYSCTLIEIILLTLVYLVGYDLRVDGLKDSTKSDYTTIPKTKRCNPKSCVTTVTKQSYAESLQIEFMPNTRVWKRVIYVIKYLNISCLLSACTDNI